MSEKYEVHKRFYDITDACARVVKEMNRLANLYESGSELSNALQTALGMVFRYEGRTQREIALIYQSDYQNMIKYISELEKRGYIEKVPKDNRRKGVFLTKLGRQVNGKLMDERGILITKTLSELDEEDLLMTKKTLDHMIDLMEERHKTYIEVDE